MKIVNLGSMNLDHVYSVPHFICAGESMPAGELSEAIGGKGLNQSVAVVRSGVRIFHAGMLGAGGEPLARYMEENGVDISLLRPCAAPQGHTVIQVDPDGQNCIIVFGGSNRQVEREYIDWVLNSFQPGDYLMLQNEISNLDYAVATASACGMKIVLNASPIDSNLLQMDLSGLDWLVVNEQECEAIAGIDDTMAAFECLKGRYPAAGILLTLGARGSISWKNGMEVRQDSFIADVVDTTGAGDTYLGYFVGSLASGRGRQEAMRLAAKAAAAAVSRHGAAQAIPWLEELL